MRRIWPLLLALVAGALWYFERPGSVDSIGVERQAPLERTAENDIEALFDLRRSDVQVRGAGTVLRTLSDDDEGSRHQRFILELASGVRSWSRTTSISRHESVRGREAIAWSSTANTNGTKKAASFTGLTVTLAAGTCQDG